MTGLTVELSDKVATVTLDRAPVNALTLALYEELGDLMTQLGRREDIGCIVLAAGGSKAFCAGLDLKEFLAATVEEDPKRAAIVRAMFASVRHCALPVVAAVNGPALGAGCVLASVCDIRIASTSATFGLPEINVGRCGGTAHMGRHLPQGLLRKMFFTGLPIDAAEAYRVGFVQELVAPDALRERAQALASIIAGKAPLGLRRGKYALNQIEYMNVDDGYAVEQLHSTILMNTADAREATRAVVEKRAPVFQGR
uniref:Enoyl-CoA hydratase-related protein n=1 Tax=Bosea sp. NBC_00436 TaxID=2969620 RepID=A0A9E7ZVA4_9HYPH